MADRNSSTPHKNSKDISGIRSGRLVAIDRAYNKSHSWYWNCKCDCGGAAVIQTNKLISGYTKSCGCLFTEAITTHGKSRTKTYRLWMKMRSRCENPAQVGYADYGGRGIKLCDKWKSYEGFLADMGERPDGYSLERKDTNGDYTPDNCRWIPRGDQNRNTRRNRVVEINGETMLLCDAIARLRREAMPLYPP